MTKDRSAYLKHILDAINDINDYIKGFSKRRFLASGKTQDAIIRKLQIIGEAVKRLPESWKNRYPEISWKKITGARDVYVHDYFDIDPSLVWETVRKNLPELKKVIKELLKYI